MSVTVILRKQRLEVPSPTTVGEALAVLNLPPELYLVVRDGFLLNVADELLDGDVIQLVGVISGGDR
jgi:sulfur carrier protein ThiS